MLSRALRRVAAFFQFCLFWRRQPVAALPAPPLALPEPAPPVEWPEDLSQGLQADPDPAPPDVMWPSDLACEVQQVKLPTTECAGPDCSAEEPWPSEAPGADSMWVRVKRDSLDHDCAVLVMGWHTLQAGRWYVVGPLTAARLAKIEELQVMTPEEARTLDKFYPTFRPFVSKVAAPPPIDILDTSHGSRAESAVLAARRAQQRERLAFDEKHSPYFYFDPPPVFVNERPVVDGPDMLVKVRPPFSTWTVEGNHYDRRRGWYRVDASTAALLDQQEDCGRKAFFVGTQEQARLMDQAQQLAEQRRTAA